MTVETFSGTIPASGRFELPPNNIFRLAISSASVDLRFLTGGSVEGATGVSANYLIKRVRPWLSGFIAGAAGTTFTIMQGTEEVIEDETDIQAVNAIVTGTVTASPEVRTPITSPAVATIATATAATITPGATTKFVTVCNTSSLGAGGTAGAYFYVQTVAAGANKGQPVQDGQSIRLPWGSSSFDLRNDCGLTASYTIQEES